MRESTFARSSSNSSKWNYAILAICLVQVFDFSGAVPNIAKYNLARRPQKDAGNKLSQKICETPACIHAAATILDNMDVSVDPCNDFYRFSCGKFIKNTHIPGDKSAVDMFKSLDEELQLQLRNSMEDGIEKEDPESFKLLQSYYETCMNQDEINKSSDNEFLAMLEKLGSWPVLKGNAWNKTNFDWMNMIHQFRRNGYSYNTLIQMNIDIDMIDNSKYVVSVDQASLGLAQQFLREGFEDKNVKAYFEYMVDFAIAFGADPKQAELEMKESLEFEMKLAKISLPVEERRDATKLYNPMSLKSLQTKYPFMSWMKYLNEILKPYNVINEDETIIVAVPTYFKDLQTLLKSTSDRVLANYLMWRVGMESSEYLGEKIQAIRTKYDAVLTGKKVQGERWKTCISAITSDLYVGAGALHVRKYFNRESKKEAEEMVETIRQSYKDILREINWMDEETRKAALEKLDYVNAFIGYPDEFFENEKLDDYYKSLKVVRNSYLKTKLNLKLFNMENTLTKLRKPVDKKDWIGRGRTAIVNAFYDPNANSMQIPAGILQGVYFGKDKPKYLNYGAIGHIMGHEITHGFDDQGAQFDKDGNLFDWWKKETKAEYLDRAQCIIDQYSNYTVEEVGLKLNGINTQGENIADNGGMKEAYFAYKNWEKQNGVEPRLPGLEYTSDQMYWISAATVYCSKYRPEALISRILTNEHSPGEYRVIGSMSNNPNFSKAFNCPLGSRMNPLKKCTVW